MAQDTDELRARIDEHRAGITETVEQIENRIMPGRIMARRRDRMRRTLTDWKDAVFGNDEPDYPETSSMYGTGTAGTYQGPQAAGQQSTVGRAGEATTYALGSAKESLHQAPQLLRRQARGNPIAAGAVALGAGWLVASLLPQTQEERAMAQRVQPKLADTATALKTEAQSLAQELKGPARDALDEVKHTGQEVASELKDEAKGAASSLRSDPTGDAS